MLKRFSDILEIKNGRNQKAVENPSGKYPIYGSGGIMGYADDYICEADTVIIGRKGNINNPIYVEEPFWNVDTAFGLVADRDFLNPRYLYYFCRNFDFQKLNTTVTIPSLTKENLLKIQMDVPEKEEQASVVMRLQKIEQLINLYKQQLEALDTLIKARFVEMFGDPDIAPRYPVIPISEITEVTSGGTPSRTEKDYWIDGDIRWVKTTELQNNIIEDTEEKITESGLRNSSAKVMPAGTILIAMYGQGKTRGMTGYLAKECTTNQACACLLPSEDINQKYLWQYMILSYDRLRDLAKGGNQPNLNAGLIKAFPVLVPPIDMQKTFAVFVTEVDKSKFYEEACAALAWHTDNKRQEWMICQTLSS